MFRVVSTSYQTIKMHVTLSAPNEEEQFLAAIDAKPHDWELRLVYADWLEEEGEHAKAAFMRHSAKEAKAGQRSKTEFWQLHDAIGLENYVWAYRVFWRRHR